MSSSAESTVGGRGRITARLIAALVFVVAAIVGAYLDWIWWPVYSSITITIAAVVVLLMGGIMALIGRVIGRGVVGSIALVVLAAGIGLVVGQSLGPNREPLIQQTDGTLTLRLSSPVVGVATGPATCTNVASATEFVITGDPNIRLDTPDLPFVSVYVNVLTACERTFH